MCRWREALAAEVLGLQVAERLQLSTLLCLDSVLWQVRTNSKGDCEAAFIILILFGFIVGISNIKKSHGHINNMPPASVLPSFTEQDTGIHVQQGK